MCKILFFSNFSCMFLNPNSFSNLNSNCSNLVDMRNLQGQVKKAFCYQKLFWPFIVWISCSNDLKQFANSWPSAFDFNEIPFLEYIIVQCNFSESDSNCRESYLFEQKLDLEPHFWCWRRWDHTDTPVMIKGQTPKANNPPFIFPLYFR